MSAILSAVVLLAMALLAPSCHKRADSELTTYDIWDADTLPVAPKSFAAHSYLVEDGMRRVAGYEDSVTLHVSFDVLEGKTLGFYVVDVPNSNLWGDSQPFEAFDSRAYLPSTGHANFSVSKVPNGEYYVIFDNRGDTTQGRTIVNVKCELTSWMPVGHS
jgi:hypothetical protein